MILLNANSAGFFGDFFSNFITSFINFFSNVGDVDSANITGMLEIVGVGVAGIFAVTIVIVAVITLLNKITSRPKKENKLEG